MSQIKEHITNFLDKLGVKWKSTGPDWIISQCPNPEHEDSNPSMAINTEDGYGKCNSCGYVVTPKFFGMDSDEKVEQLFIESTFNKVLKMLNQELQVPESKVFHLPPESKQIDSLYRGLPMDLLKKSGAYICEFGRFKGRIIFPFYDSHGTLVGYTGRQINDTCEFKDAKYLHSIGIETNKAILYGKLIKDLNLDLSKGLVIVEGNLDALALISKGIPATPLLGFKSPSTEFIVEAIELGVEKFVLAFDNDEPGHKKMYHKNKDEDDISIFKHWAREYPTELGFYSEYGIIKLLYKSNYKDFQKFIYERE